MARVLIIYATQDGQTARIAARIAETIAAEGASVKLVDAAHLTEPLDLDGFDLAVVGAPIYAGRYPRALVRFVSAHREFLERVPSAFFSVGLAIRSHHTSGLTLTLEAVEKFIEVTGWHPPRVELMAGGLAYSKYNFLVRFVMRRIASKEGGDTDTSHDYEYTDWSAVARFARKVVAEVSYEETTGVRPLNTSGVPKALRTSVRP
jgi:menaquinone-dependent protoporphyrinogen oxidase